MSRPSAAPMYLLVAALCSGGAATAAERLMWGFTDTAPGRRPAGFAYVSTGEGGDGRWEVVSDGGNHVLAQHSPARARGHRMAIADARLRNLALSVRIRAIGGERSAGLVWRYQDEGHYYLAEIDLGEQKVALYRIVGGNRSRLEREDDLELDAAAWHTLKIEHRDDMIRVWVNGVPVGRARDRAIVEPGRAGVWLPARSAAWFDDLSVAPIER